MTTPKRPDSEGRIRIAGIMDRTEAEMLIECGVTSLGFPLVLGYHPEDLSVGEAAAVVAALEHRADFFLITYLDTAASVIAPCRRLGVNCVQLHGDIAATELEGLRRSWPDLRLIKSLIVQSDHLGALADDVVPYSTIVDGFITDTFDPSTGARGATGKTHDWRISRRLVDLSPKPVILSGGLDADNGFEAVQGVRPAGVHIHTGLEGANGRKRRDLTRRFVD